MKTILTIAAASALTSLSGYAAAAPAAQDHASHNHAALPAPVAAPTQVPSPSPSATPAAVASEQMKRTGAAVAGSDCKPMGHKHMMGGDMKGCAHMMHDPAMPMAPASPGPAPAPKP